MKELKILHLLPHMLSLYGEYGNVAILSKTLEDMGHSVTVRHWNGGELDTSYDFYYVGSGTEANILKAVELLNPHCDAIRASIEAGQIWLITGNAMALFSRQGLDILPYDHEVSMQRYMGDVLTEAAYGAPMIGYINTSCIFKGITTPLVTMSYGKDLDNEKSGIGAEGFVTKNLYATQLIGPVLVKNPHFLAHVVEQLTGNAYVPDPNSNLCKAYAVTYSELSKRSAK